MEMKEKIIPLQMVKILTFGRSALSYLRLIMSSYDIVIRLAHCAQELPVVLHFVCTMTQATYKP